jgi:hypothetical protein
MLAQLTWTPDNGESETLTIEISEQRYREMRELIGTSEWTSSEAVMWIPYRTNGGDRFTDGLFRLARITALEAQN